MSANTSWIKHLLFALSINDYFTWQRKTVNKFILSLASAYMTLLAINLMLLQQIKIVCRYNIMCVVVGGEGAGGFGD